MGQLHLVLAVASAIGGLVVLVLAIGQWIGRSAARRSGSRGPDFRKLWLDRAILAAEAFVALAIATGALSFVIRGGRGPADPLHLLYAGLILVTLPLARFGGSLSERRRALALAVAGLLVVAFFVRLLQTG